MELLVLLIIVLYWTVSTCSSQSTLEVDSIDLLSRMRLILGFLPLVESLMFRGFHYKDNRGEFPWQDNNGHVVVEFETFLPRTLSVCARVKPTFARHDKRMFWFAVILNEKFKTQVPIPGIYHFLTYWTGMYEVRSYGQTFENRKTELILNDKDQPGQKFPTMNILRKWIHFCIGADFAN